MPDTKISPIEEVTYVEHNVVYCRGPVGDAHPKVYINLEIGQITACPYCSRKYAFTSSSQ